MATAITVATLNAWMGGFSSYQAPEQSPNRLRLLQSALSRLDANIVVLPDAWRWTELYTPESLAATFGYDTSYCVSLACERVDPRVGLAVLVRGLAVEFETIRLATRNGVKIWLDNRRRLVYGVYLDDLSETVRNRQVEALVADANRHRHLPMLAAGDFNSLLARDITRPMRLIGSSLRPTLLRRLGGYPATAYAELVKATALQQLLEAGFENTQAGRSVPTYYVRVPGLGLRVGLAVDHIFHRRWPVYDFRVRDSHGASDHRALSVRTVIA
ncbi:MAG TPA: endonuclease/exonuclease/phosphatase family protein [Candidatus Saccharimonas sp.]|nr:endonuclease/exonuclease/phosphatase family protein [Candidatus Saccharimonas sp.]